MKDEFTTRSAYYDDDAPAPSWRTNVPRMIAGIETLARFLADARDSAEANAVRIRAAQRVAGHAIDTRGDMAEGAQGAYSVAISALIGALGVTDIAHLFGDTQPAHKPMERPTLPGELTEDG